MRVFLALELAAPMRAAAWTWGRELAEAIGPGGASALTWVPVERLHVTLRFFGELADDRVAAIAAALNQAPIVDAAPPAAFGYAGIFPRKGRARVVWLGFSDAQDALRRLHAAVQARLGELIAPDDELFIPHLTMARVKHADRLPGRPGAFGRDLRQACVNRPPPAAHDLFRTLTLYESVADSAGRRYVPVTSVELAPAAPSA
jgi:RNA 2',3'-cyclic 3'-phosphodiesterase